MCADDYWLGLEKKIKPITKVSEYIPNTPNCLTKVVIQDAIVFKQNGAVVGTLDAIYDFGQLDTSLHQRALEKISRRFTLEQIVVSQQLLSPPIVSMTPSNPPWWRRLLSKLWSVR